MIDIIKTADAIVMPITDLITVKHETCGGNLSPQPAINPLLPSPAMAPSRGKC
jgi:hypothetical protein